jgi:hypothetical protein
MFLDLEMRFVEALRRSFARRSNCVMIAGIFDSGGMPVSDWRARERKWLLEEYIHAHTCVVKRIEDLSFSRLVSLKVCYELPAITWICWILPAKRESEASYSHVLCELICRVYVLIRMTGIKSNPPKHEEYAGALPSPRLKWSSMEAKDQSSISFCNTLYIQGIFGRYSESHISYGSTFICPSRSVNQLHPSCKSLWARLNSLRQDMCA